MIIAKRVLLGLLTLIFIIISPGYGEANNKNEVEWEIKAYDDHTIKETVKVYNNEIKIDTPAWEKSVNGDVTTLTRIVGDWRTYNELTDKLPVQTEVKNFFLWHKTSLMVTGDQSADGSVFAQTKDMKGINITIYVPGFISATSGEKTSEMSAVWKLEKMGTLTEGEVILQAVTFQGFLIGLTVFVLGLIIIAIVFIIRMKKIEHMMEAQYSLENISLEEEQQADTGRNNEDNGWV